MAILFFTPEMDVINVLRNVANIHELIIFVKTRNFRMSKSHVFMDQTQGSYDDWQTKQELNGYCLIAADETDNY